MITHASSARIKKAYAHRGLGHRNIADTFFDDIRVIYDREFRFGPPENDVRHTPAATLRSSGSILWFIRNRLVGSYFLFTAASRWRTSGRYALFINWSP